MRSTSPFAVLHFLFICLVVMIEIWWTFVLLAYCVVSVVTVAMLSHMLQYLLPSLPLFSVGSSSSASASDGQYHAPRRTAVNDLDKALDAGGVYGFVFNTSQTPADRPYQTYNWCNMPHVRRQEYSKPPAAYQLKYAELIHRHHKRTERWNSRICWEANRMQAHRTATTPSQSRSSTGTARMSGPINMVSPSTR